MTHIPITRRHFLRVSAAASGGMLIGFYLPDSEAASIQPRPWTSLPQGAEINALLAIDSEGNATIRVPHTEMEQGATSVSMMIAEELDVDWTRPQLGRGSERSRCPARHRDLLRCDRRCS